MIPFSPPRIDQAIIDEVVAALRSGWITTGPRTKRFEQELAAYCKVPAVLCLNSATAGLELMLRWFGVGPGDEVILPAYTYSATANVVVHCGATPVFTDVRDDFNMDPEAVTAAINERTKVIMPVDFGGWPCDYRALNELVRQPNVRAKFRPNSNVQATLGRILVLSDSAHSLGAWYHGQRAGSLTDCSVFSFHAVKNLTTAEGGAVALNLPVGFDNAAIYQELCVKSLHGQNKDALAKMQKGNWRYDIVEAGYKMNMTDLLAAIGLVELARYDRETLPKRKAICEAYRRELGAYAWAELPLQADPDCESSYHLFPLRIRGIDEATRDRIIQRIAREDVSVNVHFIPVPMMSFYRGMGYDIQKYPNTFRNYEREISLPVFYDLTDEQRSTVVEVVARAVTAELDLAVLPKT
ncbi:MAG TPA: DegT/DnrJ/EryC1/StrS aminotransferase family protein [Bacteroidia bacterium]|nr:DegT/DnrJ/EryC1/StrS aminotransferase family protein [Bacteroidia bacterium]